MKIGIVTEYFFPTLGGIPENVYHMSRELLNQGHDFRIITARKGGLREIDQAVEDRLIFIGKSTPTFFNGTCGSITTGFGLTRKMKKVLKEEKFDIIHLHSPIFPTLPMIANMQANAPLVATFHTCSDNKVLYKIYRGLLQRYMDRIAGKIAVSKCCAEENQVYFDGEFDIIPNGVDVAWWTTEAYKIDKFNDDTINIFFIGRPDMRNGLHSLIESFTKIHKKYPKTRLIIVGDGPLRFYFESLVPEEIKDSVFFEGSALEERRHYMATADILCFTPDIASFGITILEGMSAGKAIVASDIEAFRDLVTNEESALLVEPGNVDQLTGAIERLVKDDDLRESLGTTALRRVDHYDWKRVTDLHLKYYKKILESV